MNEKGNYLGLILFMNFLFCYAEAATLQNVTNLRRHLFETNEYDKLSRPMHNQSVPTRVRIGLSLSAIYNLDEVSQMLKTAGHLHVEWLDEALMWNPEDFGGITSAMYPQGHVWLPDVSLMNSVQDYQVFGHPTLNIFVTSNGTVQWQPYQVFMSTCRVDTDYFPFDTQTCGMTFVTWSYSNSGIIFDVPRFSPPVDLSMFQNSSGWEIVDTYYEMNMGEKPSVTFFMKLERKPAFVISSIVLPLIILSLLNVCVFVLPCESGEKASYSITVFLSFVVFATLLQGTLPESAETSQSYLAIYINIQTVQSAAIAIIALVCIRIHNLKRPVPRWLVNIFFPGKVTSESRRQSMCDVTALKPEEQNVDASYHRPKQCFLEPSQNKHYQETEEKEKKASDFSLKPEIGSNQTKTCKSDDELFARVTWKDVTDKIDMGFFVFFLVAEMIVTFVFFMVTNVTKMAS